MDDLAKRLTERLRRRDEKIAALEARIAKADALAEACEELIASMAQDAGEIDRKLANKDARANLAAYREGSDT